MKIEGSYDLPGPRPKVWAALLDPTRLAAAMAGCEKLDAVGEGEYRAILKIGVGAVKGTFEGKVTLSDLEPPSRYKMTVEGSGGPGFVRGAAALELADVESGTRVSYSADVQVGGLIASVGQRMLGGMAKMLLDDFFSRMSEQIQG